MSIDILRERERETWMWERNINRLPAISGPTRDGTQNLGVCPDQESNLQPFGIWDTAPTNWAARPGQHFWLFYKEKFIFENLKQSGSLKSASLVCFTYKGKLHQ